MSLLPQDHSEFRSKQYWDDFFLKRESSAFEWYGDYTELSVHVERTIKPTDRILVIGCGNSNFSSDLYDKGFHNIVNLDFSELVIKEMIHKNTSRSSMLWHVGDMTDLHQYANGSFDAVFDKGALDALMSTDCADVREKAINMFNEVSRVLDTSGKYLCITLAERYIIQCLLGYYCANSEVGYSISVDCVVSKKESPFVPFYVEIIKTSTGSSISNAHNIRLHMDEFGQSNPVQLSRLSVVCVGETEAVQQLTQIQIFHQKQYQIAKIEVGHFEKLQFWSDAHSEIPRFTIFMLDHSEKASVTLTMAVFMVPFGRESDFQFTTAEGLSDIASQANCKRLLAVCCNRPHIYPEMIELQAELNPIVLSLKPRVMDATEKIPYMAVNAESDWEVIDTGRSEQSGEYVVEEGFDDDVPDAVMRRLIFLQNQNFVQTEVRMVQPRSSGGGAANKSKAKKGKKGKKTTKSSGNNSNSGDGGLEFDYSYLDAHHCAAMCALTMLPQVIHGAHKVTNPVTSAAANNSNTVSTPTTALLIGLGGGALHMCLQRYLPNLHLFTCDLDPTLDAVAREHFGFKCNPRSISFPADGIQVLDQLFQKSLRGEDFLSDCVLPAGLKASPALDVLFIDADCKDTTLGISAPPAPFLTISALIKMHAVIKAGGGVYFNIVARNKHMLAELVVKLAAVFNIPSKSATPAKDAHKNNPSSNVAIEAASEFSRFKSEVMMIRAELGLEPSVEVGKMYHIQASAETRNEGILLIKGQTFSSNAGSSGGSRLADCYDREELMEFWLKSVGMGSDPLKLTAMLDKYHEIRI